LIFNCALEYAFQRDQVNQDGLELNGALQLLVYVVNVNILGGGVCTIKKNKEPLVDGLEVNAKHVYFIINRVQNAGRNHSIKSDNSSFESVEDFEHFGTILTHQNCIQEGKSRLLSENTWHH
jgi:hypothetical protein